MRTDVLLDTGQDTLGMKEHCSAELEKCLAPFASEIHYASLCLEERGPRGTRGSPSLRLRVDFHPHGRLLLECRDEPDLAVLLEKGMRKLSEGVEGWLVARWRMEARQESRALPSIAGSRA